MKSRVSLFLLLAVLLAYFYALLQTAWLCDDAFITFRVVNHFLNGYGLCWNIAERVQVYTHPLWMMLLTIACSITRDFYFTPIWLSIVLSVTTMALLSYQNRAHPQAVLIACSLLLFSKSFVDYSTSGLENPICHLLLLLFFGAAFKKAHALTLSLLGALLLLNRLDHVFLLLPVLIFLWFERWDWSERRYALLGFLPFFLWELFSLFYYGFLFPNTAYAKLYGADIPLTARLEQGLYYTLNLLQNDPIAGLTLAGAFAVAVFTSSMSLCLIACGIVFHFVYILWIGGDFMSGRMFTPSILAAAFILSRTEIWQHEKLWIPVLLLIFLIGMLSPTPPLAQYTFFRTQSTGSA